MEEVCKKNRPQRAEEQVSIERSAECTETKGALRGERSYLSNTGIAEVLEAKQHGTIDDAIDETKVWEKSVEEEDEEEPMAWKRKDQPGDESQDSCKKTKHKRV